MHPWPQLQRERSIVRLLRSAHLARKTLNRSASAVVVAHVTHAGFNKAQTMNQGTEFVKVKPACCWPAALVTMSSSPCVPEVDWTRLTNVAPRLVPGISVPALLVATIAP